MGGRRAKTNNYDSLSMLSKDSSARFYFYGDSKIRGIFQYHIHPYTAKLLVDSAPFKTLDNKLPQMIRGYTASVGLRLKRLCLSIHNDHRGKVGMDAMLRLFNKKKQQANDGADIGSKLFVDAGFEALLTGARDSGNGMQIESSPVSFYFSVPPLQSLGRPNNNGKKKKCRSDLDRPISFQRATPRGADPSFGTT